VLQCEERFLMLQSVHECMHVSAFLREIPASWDQEHIPYGFPKCDETPAAPPAGAFVADHIAR
jgi:hypothetical protein